MPQSVFVSYARKTNLENARALRDALGADVCFLDEHDIELGAQFPKAITDALLTARVVVVFADATYFQRWYCLREWLLARAPFDAIVKRGASAADRDAAFAHVVVALDPSAGDSVLRRLPPSLQAVNCPPANDVDSIAKLVHERLAAPTSTLRELCERARVPAERLTALRDEAAMPPAGNVAGIPLHPSRLPQSLHGRFVGRVDDLWRLHVALTETRLDSLQLAALTGAVQGGGGFGKTQLALEYLWRFGPSDFRGGLFWIDATEAEPLERQLHGVLRVLRPATPPIEAMRDAGRDVRTELEQALHEDAATESILFVVDNVPEPKVGAAPEPLDRWCPALGKVTCLATSRKRLEGCGATETIDIDVLEIEPAVALLVNGVARRSQITESEWRDIAEWVGRLPLALSLLNAALHRSATTPTKLRDHARGTSTLVALDAHMDALRDTVPPGALRGITEALSLSYELLDGPVRTLARKIAWLAAAPLPDELIANLAGDTGAAKSVVMLADRSFLTESRSSSGRQMHRVLADFLRSRSERPFDECLSALQSVRAVLDAVNLDHPSSRAVGVAAIPHALAAAERTADLVRLQATQSDPSAWAAVERVAFRVADIGTRCEEREPLANAIELYRTALSLTSREHAPRDWATTQNNLGNVLQTLGAREEGTQRLKEAVSAYRSTLEVYTREGVPLEWAMTQNNLGNALEALGLREDGTQRLEEAVAAFRSALEVLTRGHAPLQWAATQTNLGAVLQTLGEREEDTQRLDGSVAAFRSALEVHTRERTPQQWATTKNNLGNVLATLGKREEGTQRLEEAVATLRSALEIRTRERAPLEWAMTQNNLGNVLVMIGEREEDTKHVEQAIEAFRGALDVRERAGAAYLVQRTKRNLEWAENSLTKLRRRDD